jgi:hypothetical protein
MHSNLSAGALLTAALTTTLTFPTTAALTFELRVPNTTSREVTIPSGGGTFHLQLFARITDTPNTDGLGTASLNLFSKNFNTGVVTGGGVTAFELDTLGRRNFGLTGGAQNGGNPALSDFIPSYSTDGVQDWGTAETFGGSVSTVPTNPGSRAKFNRSITYIATNNTQTAGAFYTIGNEILIGTFTLRFSSADVNGGAVFSSRTRFQLDLVRRASLVAPGATQWIENYPAGITSPPSATLGLLRSPTVAASFGADSTRHNIGFADSELAYVDFKLNNPLPSTPFIDLVASYALIPGLPFLGTASLAAKQTLPDPTKGGVQIAYTNDFPRPDLPIFIAFDLVGGLPPNNLTIVGGEDASGYSLASVQAIYGSEFDVVLRFSEIATDIAFDFDSIAVRSLIVLVPEPTSLALLALPAAALLRRRR